MEPKVLMIRLHTNCNAGCSFCGFARNTGKPMLSEEDFELILRKIKDTSFELVRFTGGEPLLHNKLPEYIAKLKEGGLKTSIISNGYFLPYLAEKLAAAGLDQIVLSLDASNADLHNSILIRNTPSLFENMMEGIQKIRELAPGIIIRINTVAGPHNIDDLELLHKKLVELEIDQWSIIPVKGLGENWIKDKKEFIKKYRSLQNAIDNSSAKIELLGESRNWAGRTEEEVEKFASDPIPFTPRESCRLVEQVRFYDPVKRQLTPCNCANYRLDEFSHLVKTNEEGQFDLDSAKDLVDYLGKNGPQVCKGCEPTNQGIGEDVSLLEGNIFAW